MGLHSFLHYLVIIIHLKMKNYFMTAAVLAVSTLAQAQVTWEADYEPYQEASVYKIEGEGHKYGGKSNSGNIRLYNSDHSLWKEFPVPSVAGTDVFYSIIPPTKYLFNSDDEIEMGVLIYGGSGSADDRLLIFSETGTIIFDHVGTSNVQLKEVNGQWKLLLVHIPASPALPYVKVFGLPGTYTTGPKTLPGGINSQLYPNPVTHAATVSYKLPDGVHTARMTVTNSAGQVVKTYTITDQYSNILIQKDAMAPGLYSYTITSTGAAHHGGTFIVQ
jgi:hypothetical protein